MSLIAACLCLGACSDEEVAVAPPSRPAPTMAVEDPIYSDEWLSLTDGVSPDHWLASRAAGRDLDPDDPAVKDMRRLLDDATKRFRDHPRMVANRSVQLEAMLSEKGIDERAPQLIEILSQVPGEQRSVESYAAMTQQYYNLRMEGLDRGQALEVLQQRIGRTAGD